MIKAAVLSLLLGMSLPVLAENARRFDIPSQDLASSLNQFAVTADWQIVFAPELVKDLRARALQGSFTREEAIGRLLRGTGLENRFLDDKTVIVVPSTSAEPTAHASTAGVMRLAQAQTTSQPSASSTTSAEEKPSGEGALEEVTVTGKRLNYNVVESANKMPLSVKDTPQSVKVITEDMLDFAGIDNFNDMYKLDAGAPAANSGYRQTYHYSRGFSSSPSGGSSGIRVDGFRTATPFMGDLAVFERIELVKGSTSTLYGQASLAGTMNAITKKPTVARGGKLSIETGSHNWFRGEGDYHGALTADEKLTFRVVGAGVNADSYWQGGFEKSYIIAPSLQYEFTPDTRVRIQTFYQESSTQAYAGVGLQADDATHYSVPDISRRTINNPPWATQDREAFFVLGVAEHRFANDWQLRGAATHYRVVSDFFSGYTLFTDGGTGLTQFVAEAGPTTYISRGLEANLHGPFEAFGQEHQAFLGVDYTEYGSDPSIYTSATITNGTGFSVYDQDWSQFPKVRISDFLRGGRFAGVDDRYVENTGGLTKQFGTTAQLILHPVERWGVVLGARRSQADQTGNYRGCYGAEAPDNPCFTVDEFFAPRDPKQTYLEASAWTYQAGTTFEITADINIYASYGQTFEPREDRRFDPDNPGSLGIPLGNEEGDAYELGFKGEMFGGRFSWSAAYFDQGRLNVTEEDIAHPGFSIALGEQRSEGVEVDFQGELLPGLGVYLSAVKMRNEYTGKLQEGQDILETLRGFRSNLGPKLGVSAFANYQLQSGILRGLGLGGGLIYKDRVTAYDIFNTWPTRTPITDLSDDIVQLDLRAYYQSDTWNYEIAATNVLDEAYWSLTRDSGACCIFGSEGPQVRIKVTKSF